MDTLCTKLDNICKGFKIEEKQFQTNMQKIVKDIQTLNEKYGKQSAPIHKQIDSISLVINSSNPTHDEKSNQKMQSLITELSNLKEKLREENS